MNNKIIRLIFFGFIIGLLSNQANLYSSLGQCPAAPRSVVYLENKTAQAITAVSVGGFEGQDLDDHSLDLNSAHLMYCPKPGTTIVVPRETKKQIFMFKRGKSEQFVRSVSLGIAGDTTYSFFKQTVSLPGLSKPIMLIQRRDSVRIVKGGETLFLGIVGPDNVPLWFEADYKEHTASFKTADGVYKVTFYSKKAGLGVFAYDDVIYEISYEASWVASGRRK